MAAPISSSVQGFLFKKTFIEALQRSLSSVNFIKLSKSRLYLGEQRTEFMGC